jgi:hypothetical protein
MADMMRWPLRIRRETLEARRIFLQKFSPRLQNSLAYHAVSHFRSWRRRAAAAACCVGLFGSRVDAGCGVSMFSLLGKAWGPKGTGAARTVQSWGLWLNGHLRAETLCWRDKAACRQCPGPLRRGTAEPPDVSRRLSCLNCRPLDAQSTSRKAPVTLTSPDTYPGCCDLPEARSDGERRWREWDHHGPRNVLQQGGGRCGLFPKWCECHMVMTEIVVEEK